MVTDRRAVFVLPRALACALAVAWAAAPCRGQVSLGQVTLGWEGQTHEGFLTVASIELANSGDRDVRGTAYVEMPHEHGAPMVYTHTVDMPAGGHKLVVLYPKVVGSTGSQECRVGFRPARGPKVERALPLRPRSPEEIIVLVCTESPPGAFNFIQMIDTTQWFPTSSAPTATPPTGPGGRRRMPGYGAPTPAGPTKWGVSVAYTTTDGLPDDWRGYDGLELVVLDDFSPQAMSPSRQEALLKWMGGGGRVLATGGEQYRRLSESFLAPYLAVAPEGTRTAPAGLPALVQRFGGRMESAATAITVGKSAGGTVWVAQDGAPLVASTRVGLGTLWYTAFSFTKRPVAQWDGCAQLLSWMLKVGRQRPASIVDLHNPTGVARELASHSGSNPPSFRVITLFLLAYVLCLVPANYLVLRKLDRRELAWVTTPAIVVVFSLLAYGLGFVLKGRSIVLTSASVLELQAGTSAGIAQSYYSLFSPRRAGYELTFREPRIEAEVPSTADPRRYGPPEDVRLDTPFEVASSEQDSIHNLVVQMWDQRTISVKSPTTVEGDVSATLALAANGTLQGQLTNQFATPITGASLIFRGERATLGTLEPGTPVPVSLPGIRAPRGGEPTPIPPRSTEDRSGMMMGPMGGMMPMPQQSQGRAPEAAVVGEALDRGLAPSDERFKSWVATGFVSNTSYPFPDSEALLVGWTHEDPLGIQLKGSRAPGHTARTAVIVHIPVP